MQMTKILTSASAARFVYQLHQWFEQEWGNVDSPEPEPASLAHPPPLVAVDDDYRLLGGIAFTTYPEPQGNQPAVWINALLVAPEFRGRGIARELIYSAEIEAKRLGIAALYVHTDVPGLYQRLGWSLVGHGKDNVSLLHKVMQEEHEI